MLKASSTFAMPGVSVLCALALGFPLRSRADAVMTADKALGAQAYIEAGVFPANWITDRWKEGKGITSAAFRNGKWMLVASSNSGFTDQTYSLTDNMPYHWMDEKRLDSYYVTALAGGGKRLFVAMSRGKAFTDQQLPNATMFVGSANGFWQTSMGKINGSFLTAESKTSDITAQVGAARSEFPRDFIKDNWAKGYRITVLFFAEGGWYVIMSQTNNALWDESYVQSKDIDAKLKDGWKIKVVF